MIERDDAFGCHLHVGKLDKDDAEAIAVEVALFGIRRALDQWPTHAEHRCYFSADTERFYCVRCNDGPFGTGNVRYWPWGACTITNPHIAWHMPGARR